MTSLKESIAKEFAGWVCRRCLNENRNNVQSNLCIRGHLIETFVFDKYGSFAGSNFEAELSDPDHPRWKRLAAKCDGAGHRELKEA